MSRSRIRFVTHMNEVWGRSYIWTNHVTNMNDLCRTCEWVMLHILRHRKSRRSFVTWLIHFLACRYTFLGLCIYIYLHIYIYTYKHTGNRIDRVGVTWLIHFSACRYTFFGLCIYIYLHVYIHTYKHTGNRVDPSCSEPGAISRGHGAALLR